MPPLRSPHVTRRNLLIGGGAGVGLLVAWAVWPRDHRPNLVAAPGETIFGPFLKIGEDGQVTVVVPQAESGQGVYTALPQIVADELGADWRTVAVEAAPINPLYANRLLAAQLARALAPSSAWAAERFATREAFMVTAGSTSVRAYEPRLREAGAAARSLLCMAAADRWDVAWEACDTEGGFVVNGDRRLRFAELAAEAAGYDPPDPAPLRVSTEGRLSGQSLPRLDLPAKVDGSVNFTADVRLPNMVFAAVRQGTIGDSRLLEFDKAEAEKIPGVVAVIENPRWLAAAATNWWAANRALDAMSPKFETEGGLVDDSTIEEALETAFEEGGVRIHSAGDLTGSFKGALVHVADYAVAPAVHAAMEPMTATADWSAGRLQLWLPTEAPVAARREVAAALDVGEDDVVLHPMQIGGSFGRKLGAEAAVQAAIVARQLKRPVQLTWSRVEDLRHDRFRAPARARMAARLASGGRIDGWLAKIAAPASGREVAARLAEGLASALVGTGDGDPLAVSGALPPYAIPNLAIDHHPAEVGIPLGYWRGAADSYTAFFTESFVDELARVAGVDPFSFRMALLGGQPRLARCLSMATTLGGWQGGAAGSGQGVACHMSRGSYVAVVADAKIGADQRVAVDRLVVVADVGRAINPDLVRQQLEGGAVFGLAAALGAATGFEAGLPTARRLADLELPTLATTPEMAVELIASEEEPGGATEIAVPPIAPAIANAVFAASGQRLRRLPLRVGEGQ